MLCFLMIVSVVLYICQLIGVYVYLFMGGLGTKKQFLWWHVPFIPAIVLFITQLSIKYEKLA